MRRGSTAISIVVDITVVLLVILLAIGIVRVIKNQYDVLDDDLACGAQIMAHSAVVSQSNEMSAPTISCPTRRVIVDSDTSSSAKNDLVAKEMARCWTIWGQGKLQLFGDAQGVYCHVCSTIHVDDASPLSGLPQYLDDAVYKHDLTYAQYLVGASSGTFFSDAQSPLSSSLTIPTEDPVGVIFYYAKGNEWYRDLWNVFAKNPEVSSSLGAGTGYLVVGSVSAASGLFFPIAHLAGLAGAGAGGASGAMLGPKTIAKSSFISAVVARPLNAKDLEELGCQYAPVDET